MQRWIIWQLCGNFDLDMGAVVLDLLTKVPTDLDWAQLDGIKIADGIRCFRKRRTLVQYIHSKFFRNIGHFVLMIEVPWSSA